MAIAATCGLAGLAFLLMRGTRDAASQPPRASLATSPSPALPPPKALIPYDEAQPILRTLRGRLPSDLQAMTPTEIETGWPAWVARHNVDIRARLERGDEDSIVNFWLYGTTFTTLPRATDGDVAGTLGPSGAANLLQGRLEDLLSGVASPGANERLQFARQVIDRHGIDPTTPDGRDKAWDYLVGTRARVAAETDRYRRTAQSAKLLDHAAELNTFATLYRDRGLSSDTRINVDFALDRTLEAMKSSGGLDMGGVRRVAVVGPGLDFTDKAEGYDFYPPQTIQPFAIIDSLVRLGFSKLGDLQIVTFDLSPRVNQHLDAALQRARGGRPYVLQLPLDRDRPTRQWHPDLVRYWQQLGGQIGDEVAAMSAPLGAQNVRVRAVRVRSAVVAAILPQDLNIIVERLEPLAADKQFDLVVATNVLVYYDAFDQALALANIARMLRPGGFFLTNYAVSPAAPMEASASLVTSVDYDRQRDGDTLFWYQRR